MCNYQEPVLGRCPKIGRDILTSSFAFIFTADVIPMIHVAENALLIKLRKLQRRNACIYLWRNVLESGRLRRFFFYY
jgi:hypothetical protein